MSSKAMETFSNATTGACRGRSVVASSRVGRRGFRHVEGLLASEDADHEAGDEEVDDDDEDGGDDDGLGGGSADALGSAGGFEAEVAADGGDDEAGEEGLGEALDDVSVDQAACRSCGGRSGR